ncbi:MAG TPA: phenylalanine--tRNA ligase subunit beta [Myxococcales bacterium]
MKISLNWLADYVELPASADALAKMLTMAGLEVEGVERLGEGLDGVLVGQILASDKHPNAEKLSLTKVDAGPALGELQIVCGAKNYQVGDKVPVATVGTKLPNGTKIEKAALRGIDSFGMLCSSRELGISEEASGLLILDPALETGTPIAEALGLKDVVFEVNVTPNRGDCLSHLGIAREVAALSGKPLKMPDTVIAEGPNSADSLVKVRIDDLERCPRYAARVLEGAKIGPSPAWMQNRLRAVGIRALSNAVDVTNFVLMECGQPLHAFDLDKVGGHQIVVRRAQPNEKMKTLDAKERSLSPDDLCICDERAPSALAGVMGGATSEVSNATSRILLEGAAFAPAGIRRTASRHALHSESSHRFERGVDPAMVTFAQDRAAKLLADLCGGTVAKGRVDVHGELPKPRKFFLKWAKVGELLGTPVPQETTSKILTGLGFRLEPKADGADVTAPSWRLDVDGPADCIEEVARSRGFDAIPASMPRGATEILPESAAQAVETRLRIALAAGGLDEVLNYSFVAAKDLEALTPDQKPIALKNPLAADQAVMATTRLAGLLGNLRHSLNRQVEDVRLYEIGHTYRPAKDPNGEQPADETRVLAGLMAGSRVGLQWAAKREPLDFFDLKGALQNALEAAGVRDASFEPAKGPSLLHPRSACEIKVSGGASLGFLGELHPSVAGKLDLPRGVLVFELRFDAIVAAAKLVPVYKGVPKFPAVLRDLAMVLDDAASAASVEAAIREAGGGLVEDAVLFDVFRGTNIPGGKKSLAYAIRYRAADRTLTDDEINQAHGRIVGALEQKLSATLRA